jgi:hypothetical protein
MKRAATLLSLCLVLLPLWSDEHVDSNAGEYGFQMLKIAASPQTAATGGTSALGGDDAFGFLVNPVAGAFTDTRSISITSQAWLFDTHLTNVGVSTSKGRHSFGVVFRNLDYGEFESRDYKGDVIGEYHPIDLNLIANYAVRFMPDAFFGVNLGGIYEKINTASAVGFTSDIGTAWKTPVDGMTLSGSLKYLGKTSKMNKESIDLPTTGEIGVNYRTKLSEFKLSGDFKAGWSVDDDSPKEAIGLSASYHDVFSLRAGYKFNYDLENFSSGFGLRWKKMSVDYAYLPVQNDLNDVHYIGITYHY